MADPVVVEVVEKLQSRLSPSAEPKKLLKTLKRLADLPITVDILVDTRVGKTVNGLRKHELVGELARNLVAQWKKLVPQEIPRTAEPEEREHSKSSSRKRPRSPSPVEEDEEYEEENDESYISLSGSGKDDPWQQYSDHEDFDDGREYSPELTYSPPSMSRDKTFHKENEEQRSHKEKYRPEVKTLQPEKKKEKLASKEPQRDFSSHAGSSREKLPSPESKDRTHKKEKNRQNVSKSQTDDVLNAKIMKHPEKSKPDKHKIGLDPVEKGKVSEKNLLTKDKSEKVKSKTHSNDSGTQDKKSIKISLPPPEPEPDEDEFEQPTMSFESYLSYDQPQNHKKKKKPTVKPTSTSTSTPEKSNKKQSESKVDRKEKSKAKLQMPEKKEKKESKIDQVPVLPDIPLPTIQPNYRPLPSIDTVPSMPHKRKAPLYSQEEDEGNGFTGRRLNSKMQVYSGSKSAYLPKMMSLYKQCIRVLANNIDSIYEVGGVPYSMLEPVLEKCTPEQLYRIEDCNHVLIEDSDQLWRNHCQRDFRNEIPDEYESWRELYLRLHEAREHRLVMLTQNIRSSHANKPKVRQAKMAFVNTEVKPPRDVRRRQEKFGTGAAVVSEKARIKPFMPVTSSYSTVPSEEPHSFDRPSTSSTVSTPSSVVQPGHDPRKPQMKKVAPMMAKTIKAFKNRFSRR
ncbi:elongin-A [Phyllobates terribilis]|uniref:elongin-A n=1 Tax=Phyllobates terribilis TaxID=111132 RepID=UPI003CCB1EC3